MANILVSLGLVCAVCVVTGNLDPVAEPNPFWSHRLGLPVTTVFVIFLVATRGTIATGLAAIVGVFVTASIWMIGLFHNSMNNEDIWNSFSEMMPMCALFGLIGALGMQIFFGFASGKENKIESKKANKADMATPSKPSD